MFHDSANNCVFDSSIMYDESANNCVNLTPVLCTMNQPIPVCVWLQYYVRLISQLLCVFDSIIMYY